MKRISYLVVVLLCTLMFSVTEVSADFKLPQIGMLKESPRHADFSKDGRTILTSDPNYSDQQFKIWNANTGSLISQISTSLDYTKAEFSKDGSSILVGGFYNSPTSSDYNGIQIHQYDTKTGKLTKELVNYSMKNSYRIKNIVFNKDETIAYVLEDDTVYLFDLTTGQLIEKIVYKNTINEIGYNEHSNHLLVVYEQQLNILNGDTAEYIQNIELPYSVYYGSNAEIMFAPDFSQLYITVEDEGLMVFDLKNNYKVVTLGELEYGQKNNSRSAAISPNGKYLAISSYYNVTIYNTETGQKVTKFTTDNTVYNMAFNKDGSRLLVDGTIYDASVLEQNELKGIKIYGDSNIVQLDTNTSFEVMGVNKKDETVQVDQSDVEWFVENEDILMPYYGSFYGNKEGTTLLTAKYNGFEMTVEIVVTKVFTDVPTTHQNFEAIMYMRSLNIINGYEDQTFKPNKSIPRHHVAAMIGRSGVKLPVVREAKKFGDIPTTHSNYANIQKLYQAGILDGSGNKFNPTNDVTHIQLAKILTNIFGFEKADSKNYTFNDIKASHWGQPYAEIMVSNGIMPIRGGSFNANSPVTRAQFAQYFFNALVAAQ